MSKAVDTPPEVRGSGTMVHRTRTAKAKWELREAMADEVTTRLIR